MDNISKNAAELAQLLYQTSAGASANYAMILDAQDKGYDNGSPAYNQLIDAQGAINKANSAAGSYLSTYLYNGSLDDKSKYVTVNIQGNTVNFDKNKLETCSPTDTASHSAAISNSLNATADSYKKLTGLDPLNEVEVTSFQKQRGMDTVRADFKTLFQNTTGYTVGDQSGVLSGPVVDWHGYQPIGNENVVSEAAKQARLRLEGDGVLDENHVGDGQVSKAEALAKWDKNKDGHITDKELGGLNGIIGEERNLSPGNARFVGGVKIEKQADLDKQKFLADIAEVKQGAEAGNAHDIQTLKNLDAFFSMTPQQAKSFNESVKIAEYLRVMNGKNLEGTDNDSEWKQALAMTGAEREQTLKIAEEMQGLIGYRDTEYKGIQSGADINNAQLQSDREEIELVRERQRTGLSNGNSEINDKTNSPLTYSSVNAAEHRASQSTNRAFGGMPGSSGQGTSTTTNRLYGGMPGSSGQSSSPATPPTTTKYTRSTGLEKF